MNSQEHSAALQAIARQAMVKYGLEPDWPPEVRAELSRLAEVPSTAPRDLRGLPWSSIDNDDSRDLDQLEVCIEGRRHRVC